jgi:hypothetical protein
MSKENCQKELRKQGKAYPRTCPECKLGPCKYDSENTKRPLSSLSSMDYETLKSMGFLWEFYPEATGVYSKDCQKELTDTQKVELAKKYIPRLLRMEPKEGYNHLIDRHNEALVELSEIFTKIKITPLSQFES